MKRTAIIHLFAVLTTVVAVSDRLLAQRDQPDRSSLRTRIERRFDALPLRDGVALKPRDTRSVQSIEVRDDGIAIDGQPATGAEVRQKLGSDDAALVLELSYLSRDQLREMFMSTADTNPPGNPPFVQPPPRPDVQLPPRSRAERRNRGRRDGDRVQFGSNVNIREGEVVDGDVVAIGGSVTIDGEVRGDVVAVVGGGTLGATA
jgi:hypothetical protein